MSARLKARYETLAGLPMSMPERDFTEHFATCVQTCVELDAGVVIELGCRRGDGSTIAWLWGVEQTKGLLWSVDGQPRPAVDYETDRWTFVQGDDRSPAILEQLPRVADIVFIDTSHHYDHTLEELALYVPRVRSGGRVLLHDTNMAEYEGETNYPVRRAVERFCLSEGLEWSQVLNCQGLATIYVP